MSNKASYEVIIQLLFHFPHRFLLKTDLTVVIAFIDYMALFQPVAVLVCIIWNNKHDYSRSTWD